MRPRRRHRRPNHRRRGGRAGERKEVVARQGKAKFSLINIGAKVNFDAGTITAITYPALSKVMEGIFDMPRASRGGSVCAGDGPESQEGENKR